MVGIGTPVVLHLRLTLSPCLAVTTPSTGIVWIEGGTERNKSNEVDLNYKIIIFYLEQSLGV